MAGGHAVGSWIATGSPVVAELMAECDFDFLALDLEHAPIEISQAQALFQAIRSGSPRCAPLVRLAGHDYASSKRFLDAGAMGVIAPLINTAEEAREVVDAAKYPPEGRRGVGFCRANSYGVTLEENVQRANEDILVCVQMEHVEAVRNIGEILAVEGVDVAFVGPYDLSASMGYTGQFERREFRDAMSRVLSACNANGVVPGIHVVQPDVDEAVARFRDGYRMIAYSLDITMLGRACRSGLKDLRGKLASSRD